MNKLACLGALLLAISTSQVFAAYSQFITPIALEVSTPGQPYYLNIVGNQDVNQCGRGDFFRLAPEMDADHKKIIMSAIFLAISANKNLKIVSHGCTAGYNDLDGVVLYK